MPRLMCLKGLDIIGFQHEVQKNVKIHRTRAVQLLSVSRIDVATYCDRLEDC